MTRVLETFVHLFNAKSPGRKARSLIIAPWRLCVRWLEGRRYGRENKLQLRREAPEGNSPERQLGAKAY